MQDKNKFNVEVDAGNYSIKVLLESDFEKFTNVFIGADEKAVKEMFRNESYTNRSDETIYNSLYVSFKLSSDENAVDFLFDDRAIDIKESKYRKNKEKSDDKQLVRNALLSIVALHIKKMKIEDYKEELNLEINVSTGLPVNEWKNAKNIKSYMDLFKGKHTIEFKDNYIKDTLGIKKVNLNVLDVDVQVEGMAALQLLSNFSLDEICKEQEKSEKEIMVQYKDKIVVVIDIGKHTTDIAAIVYKYDKRSETLRIKTVNELVDGIDKGIGDIIQDVINEISEKKLIDRKKKLTEEDILNAIITWDGLITSCDLNIKKIYNANIEHFSNKLSEKFIEKCNEYGFRQDLKLILLSGGGSNDKHLIETFKSSLKENNYDKDIVEVMNDYCEPVYANVFGYNRMSKFKKQEVKGKE